VKSFFTRNDDGFVLVAVIWIAGLLAVFATTFAMTVKSHTLAGINTVHNARAELIADGLARYVALELATSSNLKTNGEPRLCRWSDSAIALVKVQDQGGLVDINTASPVLLEAVLRGLGQDAPSTAKIAASMQDFRDADSQTQSGGVEPARYEGKDFGPKNEPFSIVEEIDQVPEIDDALLQKLLPFLTVTSQQTGIDASVAPRALLDSLQAAGVTQQRMLSLNSPTPAKTFGIEVTARLANGSIYKRAALIAILRQPDRPFAILSWQRGSEVEEFAATGELKPCVNQKS
jgi:general secretion pathway protein K